MKFTLIIPFYNRASFLSRTLNSILACTLKPDSILLIDNGSTDTSMEVCFDFKKSHPNLPITLLSENRLGVCYARNRALSYVTTDWVYFFDSDDELSPTYFKDVANVISRHPNLDLVVSATKMIYPDGKSIVRKVQYSTSASDQILTGQLSTQGMFFRTDYLRKIGAWNIKLVKWNDWELGVRVLLNNPYIYWLKKPYHRIYQHADSLTGHGFSDTLFHIQIAFKVVAELVQHLPQCRLALASRAIFIAAHLLREHQPEKSHCLLDSTFDSCQFTYLQRAYFYLLFLYIRYGGRGAWFISKNIIPYL